MSINSFSREKNTVSAGEISGYAPIVRAQENLVSIEVGDVPIMKNEVGYICLQDERLKAEVLRIHRETADLQVFEDTAGVHIGDRVELTGEMLSAQLGPGLLGGVFDGLQNPLTVIAKEHGFFLPRGVDIDSLDRSKKWGFSPVATIGDTLAAGQVLGVVSEGPIEHKIMVPFNEPESVDVTWIRKGVFSVNEPVARVVSPDGKEREITMSKRWPVRKPVPELMMRSGIVERVYPSEPLITTIRIIDTFFPIARGGTACIPGPFGSGKTVLQTLISRYASVDVVVIIACGERAGEVVETITEFPEIVDPRTGGSLMDRSVIICNTSAMPVAARESSLYMGITIGEYYRQMGHNVLIIADSTSRWAQAMRETSGRMEEIPGEEAFPAYLDSSIKNIYERAGVIRTGDGSLGSLTMIGTVSPAGGNFEEPVTQATLTTVKTFLGLSADRAYKRAYPAIDPLISWSRYIDQLRSWYDQHVSKKWVDDVKALYELLQRGDSIFRMMKVTGEEGISLDDYVVWQKATLIDMVYLQQDAFDDVDVSMSRDRQIKSFTLLKSILEKDFKFPAKEAAREFFTRLTGIYKNFNYSPEKSAEFTRYYQEINDLVAAQLGQPGESHSDMAQAKSTG